MWLSLRAMADLKKTLAQGSSSFNWVAKLPHIEIEFLNRYSFMKIQFLHQFGHFFYSNLAPINLGAEKGFWGSQFFVFQWKEIVEKTGANWEGISLLLFIEPVGINSLSFCLRLCVCETKTTFNAELAKKHQPCCQTFWCDQGYYTSPLAKYLLKFNIEKCEKQNFFNKEMVA